MLTSNITTNINDYKRQTAKLEKARETDEQLIISINSEISVEQKKFEKKHWFKKIFMWLPHSIKLGNIQEKLTGPENRVSKIPDTKKSNLQKIIISIGRELFLASHEAEYILKLEADEAKLVLLNKKTNHLLALARDAKIKLLQAKSTIDEAQTMEMFDAATKNKGIALMSTINNHSANKDTSIANDAVIKLQNNLQEYEMQVRDIHHELCLEYMDLSFDIFIGGIASAFGSLMSLSALSSTEKKVIKATSEVDEVLRHIISKESQLKRELSTITNKIIECKKSYRLKAIEILQKFDIRAQVHDVDEISISTITP